MNPFKICDELIKQKYRIPVKTSHRVFPPTDDWEPATLCGNTIELGELLFVIRELYEQAQAELNKYKSERGRIFEVGSHFISGDFGGGSGTTDTTIYGRFHNKQDAINYCEIKQKQSPGAKIWVSEVAVFEDQPK